MFSNILERLNKVNDKIFQEGLGMFSYFKKRKLDKLIYKGHEALVNNDLGKALSCFEKVLKIDIYNEYALVGKGRVLASLCNDNILANKYFDAALLMNPENTAALLSKAIYNNVDEAKKCIVSYMEILDIEKRNGELELDPSIFCFIAEAYLFLNEPERAISCLKKALTYNSNFVKVFADLGKSYNFLGEYEKAISYFDKAINIFESKEDLIFSEKKYPITFSGKGVALFYLGYPEESLNLFDKALKIDQYDLYSSYWKYKVLKNLNREEESKKYVDFIDNNYDGDYDDCIKSFEEVGLIY